MLQSGTAPGNTVRYYNFLTAQPIFQTVVGMLPEIDLSEAQKMVSYTFLKLWAVADGITAGK